MIKKIIHTADIHLKRTFSDEWEKERYDVILQRFIEKCKEESNGYENDEIRIVICGDLFHNKNNISNDLDNIATNFIRTLETIGKVILVSGNHDFNMNNISNQSHTITTLYQTHNFMNTSLLDLETNGNSGCIIDDNVTWALYSAFDGFMKPDIMPAKESYPSNIVIGLFHDMIVGAKANNGFIINVGLSDGAFDGCDMVLCGHIHKYQELRRNGVPIVYCGSLIQQDIGETVSQHGFVVWDLEKKEHRFIEIENEYSFYHLEISGTEEIDKVNFINY